MAAQHPASDLKQKIDTLENAIKHLDTFRKCLNESSVETKSEIRDVVTRQLASLRSREVFLLKQVDLLQNTTRSSLDEQLESLWQCLGQLKGSLDQAAGGTCSEVEKEILEAAVNECLQRCSDLAPIESPFISFKADDATLRSAIYKFGQVETRTLPLEMVFAPANTKEGQSLPQIFVDYGDDNQDVMYKPLRQQGKDQNITVSVHVPRLPTAPDSLENAALRSSHIRQWLQDLHHEVMMEEVGESLQLVPRSSMSATVALERSEVGLVSATMEDPHFKSIQRSSSKEWLKNYDTKSEMRGTLNRFSYFTTVSSKMSDWLRGQPQKDTCCSGSCTPNHGARNVDIESLHYLQCVQDPSQNQWLSTTPFQGHLIAAVCRANEKCGSFAECVCDEMCGRKEGVVGETPFGLFQALKNFPHKKWLQEQEDEDVRAPEFEYFEEVKGSSRMDWLFGHDSQQLSEPSTGGFDSGAHCKLFEAVLKSNNVEWLKTQADDNESYTEPSRSGVDLTDWLVPDDQMTMNGWSEESNSISNTQEWEELFLNIRNGHYAADLSQWLRQATKDGDIDTTEQSSVDASVDMSCWLRRSSVRSHKEKVEDKCTELPEYLDEDWLYKKSCPSTSDRSYEVLSEHDLGREDLMGNVKEWLVKNMYI